MTRLSASSSFFRPSELVLFSYESTFSSLGLKFNPLASYCGCRLCGALYQSDLDREVYDLHEMGDERWLTLNVEATARRTRWRELHAKRYHTEREVDQLQKTGFAFMPEAAHKLAPFGIAPTGNMHEEIVDAMFTAPRAPSDDAEGS